VNSEIVPIELPILFSALLLAAFDHATIFWLAIKGDASHLLTATASTSSQINFLQRQRKFTIFVVLNMGPKQRSTPKCIRHRSDTASLSTMIRALIVLSSVIRVLEVPVYEIIANEVDR
jgi:hypothetical protein